MREVVFYYDIVCPFAYLASRLVENLGRRNGAKIKWRPVLLGGLYKGTKGHSASATSDMCEAKLKVISQDLERLRHHYGVHGRSPSGHPKSTLDAMRLLAAASNISEQISIQLSHELFRAYWAQGRDVTEHSVLEAAVREIGWAVSIRDAVEDKGKELLIKNTEEALDRGAFGVPSFWVNNTLYFGVDRLHLVERALGNPLAALPRICQPPKTPARAKLTIYHDFASPWSYMGSMQIQKLVADVSPVSVEVEWVPVAVGAIFRMIGTPVVPMEAVSEAKRAYGMRDSHNYAEYLGIPFEFPTHFPLRSILPLRITLVNTDDKLRQAIYHAGWAENKNIGDPKVLSEVISSAGFSNAESLIKQTENKDIKSMLKENTDRAVRAGICGVPSYQVNEGTLIWGQDRLNIVADILCGWNDPTLRTNSKL